jgi:hypothetical protein
MQASDHDVIALYITWLIDNSFTLYYTLGNTVYYHRYAFNYYHYDTYHALLCYLYVEQQVRRHVDRL